MSETGIETDERYAKRVARVESGVSLLWWLVVYGIAVAVVLLDVLVWRV